MNKIRIHMTVDILTTKHQDIMIPEFLKSIGDVSGSEGLLVSIDHSETILGDYYDR